MDNTIALNSFYELQEEIFNTARDKEDRYNSFYHNMSITNSEDDSIYTIDYSNHKYFLDFGNIALQKILYNKSVARANDLSATFFTVTLPSKYHYFITTKSIYNPQTKKYETVKLDFDDWKVNPEYAFNTMEEGIEAGYKALSVFWRTFYNKIKVGSRKFSKLAKQMIYDVISEFHKTLQIHTHGVLYSNEELLPYIKQCFNATIDELGFHHNGCDIKQDFNSLDHITLYLVKYISKSLYSEADKESHFYELEKKSHSDFMVGWKSLLGKYSRIHKSSNTKIGIENYKKIYHNMSESDKELLLQRAKENNTCLLYEVEKHTYKVVHTTDTETEKIHTKYFNKDLKSPMFTIFIEQDKEKIDNSKKRESLLHYKSIFEKNNLDSNIIKLIDQQLEALPPYVTTYTVHTRIIQDCKNQIYNNDWFNTFYQNDMKHKYVDTEQLDDESIVENVLYLDALEENQTNFVI